MIRTLTAVLALLAAPALAQPVPEGAPPPAPPAVPAPVPPAVPGVVAPNPNEVRVTLQTAAGPIVLALDKGKAPLTTANFLRYVDQKRLDGTNFYRALAFPGGAPLGLIQGGIRGSSKLILPPVAHEPTSKTGLSHTDGAISMARTAPGTAAGDFFIIVGNLNTLDADASKPGDNTGYAVFGHVVEGMDVVRKILAAPTSATAGEGAMKGQMIAASIRISAAKRSK